MVAKKPKSIIDPQKIKETRHTMTGNPQIIKKERNRGKMEQMYNKIARKQ